MKYKIGLLLCVLVSGAHAQNINWSILKKDQNNMAYSNFGYNFGVTSQLGYGYKFKTFRTILLSADYSIPMGEKLLDDFKFRMGGQISIYDNKNLILSSKLSFVFRRHQTKLIRMANFGSEASVILGYYKPKWHFAGEFVYDNSSFTHLTHSDEMKENFSSISDGWFGASGGYFRYGIQGSKTIHPSFEISVRVGGTMAKFKDKNPILPFYGQIGLSYWF